MKYSDVYKDCKGCPVAAYCGTVASSAKACNSYEKSKAFFVTTGMTMTFTVGGWEEFDPINF